VVQPVSLSEVTAEIGSIQQLVDGGFASVLAEVSAGPPLVEAPASLGQPVAGLGLPTAVALTGTNGQGGLTGTNGQGGLTGTNGQGGQVGSQGGASSVFNAGLQPAKASNDLGAKAAALAEAFVGVPYLWGGESPAGFDCSGLVQYVYRELGVELPRTSQEQATAGVAVPSLADARPGDLVFFPGSDGTAEHPGHVGIYIGNGDMVDAPYSGSVVQVQPVGQPTEIRRVLTASPAGPARTTTLTSDLLTGTALGGTQASSVAPEAAPGPEAGPYGGLFSQASARYGLPAGLLPAMAQAESSMQPDAVSSAGAEGLMQLMPDVAAGLGVNPFEPSQAVPAAAELMSSYLRQFGSLPLALAAYNAGPEAVSAYGGVPPYPQTEAYVSKVMSLMGGQP
jgi:cell wall-associated NlpC family hydrolase